MRIRYLAAAIMLTCASGGIVDNTAADAAIRGSMPANQVTTDSGPRYEYYRYKSRYGSGFVLLEFRGTRLTMTDTAYACFSGARVSANVWKGYIVGGDGISSGSITSKATVRRSKSGGSLKFWGITATRASGESTARYLKAQYWDGTPRQVARSCRQRSAKARVKPTDSRSRLSIEVTPASSAFDWSLRIQRLRSDGSWATYMRTATRTTLDLDVGVRSRRVVDLPGGTYRVTVSGVRGFAGSTSSPIVLLK